MREVLHSTEEMRTFAERFISDLKADGNRATVVGLYGDLGAGKTTFTQAVAQVLGVNENVVSPTFVIMKIYDLSGQKWNHLIHIDAYRLEKSSELTHLGWNDLISDPKNLILIEWPGRVADVMPDHVKVEFSHKSENEREVEVIDLKF